MFPPGTRILVVDDARSLRDLVKAYLERLGYKHVDTASDGVEALISLNESKVEGAPYGLIISDWNMPNMDGVELLQAVRESPDWKQLPFLLITTESEKGKVMQAVLSQVSNYIVKPIDEETLRDKLSRVWERLKKP